MITIVLLTEVATCPITCRMMSQFQTFAFLHLIPIIQFFCPTQMLRLENNFKLGPSIYTAIDISDSDFCPSLVQDIQIDT